MLRFTAFFTVVLMSATLWLTGCGSTDNDKSHSAKTDGEHKDSSPASAKIEANLAKLPAADRAAAERQKICPISEEPLGSMGPPIKLDVEGHTVFICCKSCEEQLREDPEKHLAKLAVTEHAPGHDADPNDQSRDHN